MAKTAVAPAKTTSKKPPAEVLSYEDAAKLNLKIDEGFTKFAKSTAIAYFNLAEMLNEMKAKKGYKALKFDKWEDYLENKMSYGRTLLSYLLKLGRTDTTALRDLVADRAISGTQLLEYVKNVSKLDEVPGLVEATRQEIEGKTVKDTKTIIVQAIEKDKAKYKVSRATTGGGRQPNPDTYLNRFSREFEEMKPERRVSFLSQMEAFLKAHKTSEPSDKKSGKQRAGAAV